MSLTPVPSVLPEDFTLNIQNLDKFSASESPTFTNRLGEEKTTLAGAIAQINADVSAVDISRVSSQALMAADVNEVEARKMLALTTNIPAAIDSLRAFNARGAWATATVYALKDVYTSAGIAYVVLTPHTSTSVAADLAAGKVGVHQGATVEDLFNKIDPSKGVGMVGYDNAELKERLDRMLHIEGDNFRDFWSKLSIFNDSEDGNLTIASYGDSVSWDVATAFAWYMKQDIGQINASSFTPVEFGNALSKPTGPEAGASRAPGTVLIPTLVGGATAFYYSDGDPATPIYSPAGDLHYVIPEGGSATWNDGALTTGYQRMIAFLAIEPGAGSCKVDVLDHTNAVIATQTINCANATLGATKAEFTGLDTTKRFKLKITSTSGTVNALGVVFMVRRGITLLCWRWGGSTYAQQNQSSKVIFDYINNALNTAIIFAEAKGEGSVDGVVAGVDGLSGACTRLNALACSKVFIGSRPDNGAEARQYDAIYRFRNYAVVNDYVFVDGYNLLKNYAELQRLVWDRRLNIVETVHLPIITAYYVAGQLINRLPKGFIKNLWHTRKVVSPKVATSLLSILLAGKENDEPAAIPVIIPYPNDPSVALSKVQNVASYKVKNPYSAAECEITMYGTVCNFSTGVRFTQMTQNGSGINQLSGELRTAGPYSQTTYTGTNGWSGGLSLGQPLILPKFTVAALPGTPEGGVAFASNGRKVGEGAGAGTGVLVYTIGGIWRVFSTDAQVAA